MGPGIIFDLFFGFTFAASISRGAAQKKSTCNKLKMRAVVRPVNTTTPRRRSLLSPDGFPPRTWGPALWHVIHILAFNYPLRPTPVQKTAYYQWFKSLCTLLPCSLCRDEFCKLVRDKQSAFFLTTRRFEQRANERAGAARLRVIAYTIGLHGAVNSRLGKSHRRNARHWRHHYAMLRA